MPKSSTATKTLAAELQHHWMPFTANRDFKATPRFVTRAAGPYYWNQQGAKVLDASSGLFTSSAGHCREEITAAVHQQLKEMDYAPHFNLAHPSSFTLSRLLAKITPPGLNRFFFVNSGSEAIDSSMKLILAYWRAKKEPNRQLFISRARAYHGMNWGGTSLAGMLNNKRRFTPGLPGVYHLRHTLLEQNKFQWGEGRVGGIDLADDLDRMAQLYGGENIAACYVEPVAGSVGTYVPPKGYLKRLREICDRYGILLVFDEVITGFGRTGNAFAAHTFGVTPDVMTLAKAITNGVIPMGAVALKSRLYDAVVRQAAENAIELFHGYTYSAHPVACAAGVATQKIYQKEKLFEKAAKLAPYFKKSMQSLKAFKVITDLRGIGLMCSFDLATKDNTPGKRGRDFYQKLFWKGVHVKTTGDTVIIAPPFIFEKKHLDELTHKINEQLKTY